MTHYDVTIVGSGIHGVGVAQAAAARGYRVLLLEKTGVAAGTSSRSSKLIHGGLRYLETAQFSLVRESLREREILLKNAPELVALKRFYIPVYTETSRSPLMIRLGLSLYALIGKLSQSSVFHTVPKSRWHELDGLKTQGLRQVFCYSDAQTDDAALTQAVLNSAKSMGAHIKLPATFVAAERKQSYSIIRYRHDGKDNEIQTKVLVNAAGPWINHILARVTPKLPPTALSLVQGTHIVINRKLQRGFYYLESPSDRRAVFAMPWKGQILLGTTETNFSGEPESVEPLQQDEEYLLKIFTDYFPESSHQDIRIVDRFAGLRVLPNSKLSTFKRSRETQLVVDDEHSPKLVTIFGGKLTTYRATAEKVMQRFEGQLPPVNTYLDTAKMSLK